MMPKEKATKLNVLIIGAGHYSTGSTNIQRKIKTDKDLGVLLPSVFELKKRGFVGDIFLAARSGKKINKLKKKIIGLCKKYNWDNNISYFPKKNVNNEIAYKDALRQLPKPGVVLIATPDYLHKEMIIESIKAGFHFMVVKPAVIKVSDLKTIIKLTQKQGVLGVVDYHKAYDDANLMLKESYQKGTFGDMQHIFSKITQRKDMLEIFKSWAGDHKQNVNHYLGSHYIHLVAFITKAIPLSVRAVSQGGIAKRDYHIDTPDLIETQVEWLANNSTKFISYHVAGWSDPHETAGMTYQEIHLITTKGHIESDQRNRGYETTLAGEGYKITNPYFFHLNNNLLNNLDLDGKYGFKSIKTFINSALEVENGQRLTYFDDKLPTIKESMAVTAILEAADKSLASGSKVVNIKARDLSYD